MEADFLFKIVTVGESGVGKSCLVSRFAGQSFVEYYIDTVGLDFRVRTVEMNGKLLKLNIWDTAGQERFRALVKDFYRGAHGICFVYDITDSNSFSQLEHWIVDISDRVEPNARRLLIGTKKDLEQSRQVPIEKVEAFSDRMNIPYIETSSKNGHNVERAFLQIKSLLEDADKGLITGCKKKQDVRCLCGRSCRSLELLYYTDKKKVLLILLSVIKHN